MYQVEDTNGYKREGVQKVRAGHLKHQNSLVRPSEMGRIKTFENLEVRILDN